MPARQTPGGTPDDNVITIVSAVYGLRDVTAHAAAVVASTGGTVLSATADNATWTDSWPGNAKTFTLVYAVGSLLRTLVVKENGLLRVSAAYLNIVGAFYYDVDVSAVVRGSVHNNSLYMSVPPIPDPAPGARKCLVVYYRYNGESLQSATSVNWGPPLDVTYVQQPPAPVTPDPRRLMVVAAFYGYESVLSNVQQLISNNTCSFVPDTVFPDTWYGVNKVFSVAYRYGANPIQTAVCLQWNPVLIAPAPIKSTLATYDVVDLVEDGDVVNFAAINHLFLAVDLQQRVTASAPDLNSANALAVELTAAKTLVFKATQSSKYVRVALGSDGTLYADGATQADATPFSFALLQNGDVVIATNTGSNPLYLEYRSADQVITATGITPFGMQSGFNIAFAQGTPPIPPPPSSTCELKFATLVWQLTGGFLITIGLGLNINEGQVAPGIVGLIRSSPAAMEAIEAVLTNAAAQRLSVSVVASFIGALYEAGLLWKLLKMLAYLAGWILLGRIFAKLVAFILAPEIEAIELTAGFIVWTLQATDAAVQYSNCINTSALLTTRQLASTT